jgi:hypothetical protein
MAYLQTKTTYLGKFWRALEWKRLLNSIAVCRYYINAICYILFGNLETIWYIPPVLVYSVKKNLATLHGIGFPHLSGIRWMFFFTSGASFTPGFVYDSM